MELVVLYVVLPLLLFLVGGGIGRVQEVRHNRSLAEREAGLRGVTITNLRAVPPGVTATDSFLVIGEVVIASDYGKQILARVRNIVGGEVRSFQRLMERARREAVVRAAEEADRRGAALLVNVRFETSEVTALAAEVLCYATAVRTA